MFYLFFKLNYQRSLLKSNQLPAAGLYADTTARRCKYVHVSSAKTSMFWKLAAASTLGLLSLRFDCIRDNLKS